MTPSPVAMDLLMRVAAALEEEGPVEVATMFRSPGLRAEGKIVAFLGSEDRLIVKVPRARTVALVDEGTAQPVTMGTRTMREWVAIPFGADENSTCAAWVGFAREAYRYLQERRD